MKSNDLSTRSLLIAGILLFNIFPVSAQDLPSVNSRLQKGEIIVEAVTNSAGLPGVQARFLVKGSDTVLWQMLNDYKNYKEIYGGIDKLKVLESDHSGATIEFWSDVGNWKYIGVEVHFILRRTYDVAARKITWERVSGDLEVIEGGWEICDSPVPGSKILVYKTFIKYGGLIPTSLIRKGAMSKAVTMGESLRSWIEKHPSLYD